MIVSRKHKIKLHEKYFQAVLSGKKTFEVRSNHDRDYQPGDIVIMQEVDYRGEYVKPERFIKATIVTCIPARE